MIINNHGSYSKFTDNATISKIELNNIVTGKPVSKKKAAKVLLGGSMLLLTLIGTTPLNLQAESATSSEMIAADKQARAPEEPADSTTLTPEVAKLAAKDMERQYDMIRSSLLQYSKENNPAVTNNGETLSVTSPIFNSHKMDEAEYLTLMKRLETNNIAKYLLKDKNGKEIGINPVNYVFVLPESNINNSNAKGTIHFINVMEITIQNWGERVIYVISRGKMDHDGTSLSRSTINLTEYPLFGAKMTASQGKLINSPDGIKANDQELNLSKVPFTAKELKNTASEVYNKGDNLKQNEKNNIAKKLENFFSTFTLPQ